jgi:hypothetical protein
MAHPSSSLLPTRKVTGCIEMLLASGEGGRLGFRSECINALTFDFEGILGERHRGWTRKSDARVPYVKRGTVIRNQRHVSIVSTEDLAEIARKLDIPEVLPETLGANVVITGIPALSYLPRGTKLMLAGGSILHIEDQNAPCTLTGDAIGIANGGREDLRWQFPKLAQGLRGLVASVERPGTVTAPSAVVARLPAQWLY